MNNECGVTQKNHSSGITYKCCLYKDHSGDHKALSKHGEVMQRWTNKCRETNAGFICTRRKGHVGDHEAHGANGTVYTSWPTAGANYSHAVDEEVAAIKKQTTVLLTLEDLKAIAYYLPPYSDDKDDADNDVKAKIDKALKGML
jgi:hypothetical protein